MKQEAVQAAAGTPPWAVARTQSALLRKAGVPALFVAFALLVTSAYGQGVQLNDGQAALHIDPLKFLGQLLSAWNPALHLGTHTGFWFPYETPYAWAYAIGEVLRVPAAFSQHCIVFFVYLGCLWSMYYCLRSVMPGLAEAARIAGACAYLFNMYVALNSQAQIVWLLTYATLPAMVGITARAMRGEMNYWRAGLFIALLVFLGAGINPPLVGINAILLALFVAFMILFEPSPSAALRRTWPFLAIAAIGTIALNLYWLVPFVDFFRGAYLNGVLSEAPSMHNAATSFANVLRGLGHWATFVSFAGKAYFPWAAPYAAGLFGALLWFVPMVALAGIALRRNQNPTMLYFLIVTIVSVPLVVGYYHDQVGDAVTTPIYDLLYRNFPGFQMFRFSYKWVAGVEFGLCGLYAIAAGSIVNALRERLNDAAPRGATRWRWSVPVITAGFILMPIVIFVPVLIAKMNYPGAVLPAWEYREKALVGNDQRHRVALFPTQYLEQFDWGSPQFYIEDSLIDRPMIYGLLGSAPTEGTDVWERRTYRATREGLPFAADMLRVLGVDTILQRDDFIPVIDFSSPGEWRFNTTTLTHDLVHRVVGASQVRFDGPLRVYHLNGTLPLLYGVTHPVISTAPIFTDAYLGNVPAMAAGKAQFDPPSRSTDEFSSALQSLSPVLPSSPEQIRDLAVNQALLHGGIRVHPPPADVGWTTPFDVRDGGVYEVFSYEQSLLFQRSPAQNLEVDGTYFSPLTTGGAWTDYGQLDLASGAHSLSDGYPDSGLVVALINEDDLRAWEDRIAALVRALPHNQMTTTLVYGSKAVVTLPSSGRYRIHAGAVAPFGPDGQARTHALSRGASRGAFPRSLMPVLPFIPAAGVLATSAIMMPPQWYTDDPAAYRWQRGDPMQWLLFARDAHVRVFVTGSQAVRGTVAMRVSRLQVSNVMTVRANGGRAQDVIVAGPAAAPQAYDTPSRIDGPTPVAVNFPLELQPGWNDVDFRFHSLRGERDDLGTAVLSAAVAPDLEFTRTSTVSGSKFALNDRGFNAVAVAPPPAGLIGDPEIAGTVERIGNRGAWLAVALLDHGRASYRVVSVSPSGPFDVNFLHAFPNDWYDAGQHIAGMWFIWRDARPKFSGLYYNVHAVPGRALHHSQSLVDLPIRVDGRRIGSGPVSLPAGRHVVTSADGQVNMTLLTVEPVSLPRTAPFGVDWQRRSPTALTVTVKRVQDPFLLVFDEAYHREWQATLDGQPLPHVIVDGIINGWVVPSLPNGGEISLKFGAQALYIVAAVLSVIALILLTALAVKPELWPIGSSQR